MVVVMAMVIVTVSGPAHSVKKREIAKRLGFVAAAFCARVRTQKATPGTRGLLRSMLKIKLDLCFGRLLVNSN
jgi:hypothetical protein